MASMNPKEPACFVMLGVASIKERNYNLAVAAFKKAIKLGSPQAAQLRQITDSLDDYIWESHKANLPIYMIVALIPLIIVIYIFSKIRKWRKRIAATR